MDYVIGIDGGGTKTRATTYLLHTGESVYSVETGRANFAIQFEESLEQIVLAIEACIKQMGGTQPKRILIGASGAHSPEICKNAEMKLNVKWSSHITVIDDATLAHIALLHGKDGLLIIAGTGSIVLGRYNGKVWRTGGWGYLLGDEGSGYWISIQALKYAMKQLELNKVNDKLTKAILNNINGYSMSDIKRYVYSSTRHEIARLSKLVNELAEQNCEAAREILNCAGVELAELLMRAISQFSTVLPKQNIVVSGSLLQKNEIVYQSFFKEVRKNISDCNIIKREADVCEAVLYYA